MGIQQGFVSEHANTLRFNVVAFLNNSTQKEYDECIELVKSSLTDIPSGMHSGDPTYTFKNIFTDIIFDLEERHSCDDMLEKFSVNITEFFNNSTIPQAKECLERVKQSVKMMPYGQTTGEPMSYINKIFQDVILGIEDLNKPAT